MSSSSSSSSSSSPSTNDVTSLLPNAYWLGYRTGYAVQDWMENNNTTDWSSSLSSNMPSVSDVYGSVTRFPALYAQWWLNLVAHDPIHVAVETTLLISIVYILLSRSKEWREVQRQRECLTDKERQDLLREWKDYGRAPLTPSTTTSSDDSYYHHEQQQPQVVVHKSQGKWMHIEMVAVAASDHPNHHHHHRSSSHRHGGGGSSNSRGSKSKKDSEAHITTMTQQRQRQRQQQKQQHKQKPKPEPVLHKVLNFATFDFLGMSSHDISSLLRSGSNTGTEDDRDSHCHDDDDNDKDTGVGVVAAKKEDANIADQQPRIQSDDVDVDVDAAAAADDDAATATTRKTCATTTTTTAITATTATSPRQAAVAALHKYGCGSCGPRGFYGTIDTHLDFEAAVAAHMGTESAILYSDGASAVSSTIAAFCKRGDLLVVDAAVSEPVYTGITLSRAHVKWFAHNDVADLRRVLEKVSATDKQLGRRMSAQRRFLIVEGLYRNTGTVCPLADLVKLKHEYSYRLIVDESCSFGVLGRTGLGVTEHASVQLQKDVEIAVLSLEYAVGSVGGVTVGSEEIVDHQRLSGSGYCFSASSPPFTAAAAGAAIKLMQPQQQQQEQQQQQHHGHDDDAGAGDTAAKATAAAAAPVPSPLVKRLADNRLYMYRKLKQVCSDELEGILLITSDEASPLVFLQVADCEETQDLNETVFYREVVRECLQRGVAYCAVGQGNNKKNNMTAPAPAPAALDIPQPAPAIRLTVTAAHDMSDIDRAITVLAEAVTIVMDRFHHEDPVNTDSDN